MQLKLHSKNYIIKFGHWPSCAADNNQKTKFAEKLIRIIIIKLTDEYEMAAVL